MLAHRPLSTLVLPGETQQLHLRGRQRDACQRAVEHDFGLLAMQHTTPAGNVPNVAPLVEVISLSEAGVDTFATIRCVGRCRLREVRSSRTRAVVSPFCDASSALNEASAAESVAQRVVELHATCFELDRSIAALEGQPQPKMVGIQAGLADDPAMRSAEESARDDPTRGVRMARHPALFHTGLHEQMAVARGVLLGQAAAQLMWPEPSLARLPLWGDSGDGEPGAEQVLLSFAAHGNLSPFERLRALDTTLTADRLHNAATALSRQQARLAAMLALRRAAPATLE